MKKIVPLCVGLGVAATTGFTVVNASNTESQRPKLSKHMCCENISSHRSFAEEIAKSEDNLQRVKDEVGAPGIVVAASVDGKVVWNSGIGYADVENRVPCSEDTVMRIASISKPMAMAILARLWEAKKVDLDLPITKYVKDWPEKTVNNEKVEITTRQLISHLGGIRHYEKKSEIDRKKREKENKAENKEKKSEFDLGEYHLMKKFHSVSASLKLFKNDELCSKPGTEFLYTTHGYTLLSAVIEGASGETYEKLSKEFFREMGMSHTYLDENEPIIYGRSRYYEKDKNGRLKNTPYVDNSYKWAGGGYISTAGDLVKFANVMLYSYQKQPKKYDTLAQHSKQSLHRNIKGGTVKDIDPKPGYLQASTMKELWSPVEKANIKWDIDGGSYGMGWGVMPEIAKYGQAKEREYYVSHTGGAIGASSVLLVLPRKNWEQRVTKKLPQGVSVAVITNLQGVNLSTVALKIAQLFETASVEK